MLKDFWISSNFKSFWLKFTKFSEVFLEKYTLVSLNQKFFFVRRESFRTVFLRIFHVKPKWVGELFPSYCVIRKQTPQNDIFCHLLRASPLFVYLFNMADQTKWGIDVWFVAKQVNETGVSLSQTIQTNKDNLKWSLSPKEVDDKKHRVFPPFWVGGGRMEGKFTFQSFFRRFGEEIHRRGPRHS